MFLYFILPSTSSVIFSMFSCITFDMGDDGTVSYQQADLSLTCAFDDVDTVEREGMLVLAGLMVVIFPLGVPLGLYGLMYARREAIEGRESRRGGPDLENLSFLFRLCVGISVRAIHLTIQPASPPTPHPPPFMRAPSLSLF